MIIRKPIPHSIDQFNSCHLELWTTPPTTPWITMFTSLQHPRFAQLMLDWRPASSFQSLRGTTSVVVRVVVELGGFRGASLRQGCAACFFEEFRVSLTPPFSILQFSCVCSASLVSSSRPSHTGLLGVSDAIARLKRSHDEYVPSRRLINESCNRSQLGARAHNAT